MQQTTSDKQRQDFKGITIAVVAGDRREQEIARLAAVNGATVRAFGFPWPEPGIVGVEHAQDAHSALKGAHFGLFPIPGSSADGALFSPAFKEKIIPDAALLGAMAPGAHIFLGITNHVVETAAKSAAVTLHEYDGDTQLMYLRAPAVVEGILKVLIENTDFTIKGAQIAVVGQGTISSVLTRTLILLGGHVHVFARNPTQRAAAMAFGAVAWPLDTLGDRCSSIDILISCVPAKVVNRAILQLLPKRALVVDVAAPPGGVDLATATELGLRNVWARGLGNRAPAIVGASQWVGLEERIRQVLAGPNSPCLPSR
jgi:dipicolinate synthase subunit A